MWTRVAPKDAYRPIRLGCIMAPPGEYRVRWRCGLMSNYFDHLLEIDTLANFIKVVKV